MVTQLEREPKAVVQQRGEHTIQQAMPYLEDTKVMFRGMLTVSGDFPDVKGYAPSVLGYPHDPKFRWASFSTRILP